MLQYIVGHKAFQFLEIVSQNVAASRGCLCSFVFENTVLLSFTIILLVTSVEREQRKLRAYIVCLLLSYAHLFLCLVMFIDHGVGLTISQVFTSYTRLTLSKRASLQPYASFILIILFFIRLCLSGRVSFQRFCSLS